MIRVDGAFCIFRVQGLWPKTPTRPCSSPGTQKWFYVSFDVDWGVSGLRRRGPHWKAFSASGACWQRTGIFGSFEYVDALHVRDDLLTPDYTPKDKPQGIQFRVVEVNIAQATLPLTAGEKAIMPVKGLAA